MQSEVAIREQLEEFSALKTGDMVALDRTRGVQIYRGRFLLVMNPLFLLERAYRTENYMK